MDWFRHILLCSVFVTGAAAAQELLEPPVNGFQDKLTSYGSLIEVNGNVYFIGESQGHGKGIFRLDPTLNVVTLEARIPHSRQHSLTGFTKIGNRLLFGDTWYDPKTKLFSYALAKNEKQFDGRIGRSCYLKAWDDAPLLSCDDNIYKLNAEDGLFHAHDYKLTAESNYLDYPALGSRNSPASADMEGGVFCYSRGTWDRYCSEWPGLRTIKMASSSSARIQEYQVRKDGVLWWTSENNVYYKTWAGVETKLNKEPLTDDWDIFASTPRFALMQKGSNNTGFEYQRFYYQNSVKEKITNLQVVSSFHHSMHFLPNDDFIAVDRNFGIIKLAANATSQQIIRPAEWQVDRDGQVGFLQFKDALLLKFPLRDDYDSGQEPTEQPFFATLTDGKYQEKTLQPFPVPGNTPIDQVFVWKNKLHWFEYNGPFLQLKQFDKASKITSIVYQYAGVDKLTEREGIFTTADSMLMIKDGSFLKFSASTGRFEKITQEDKANAVQGMQVGNIYYYYIVKDENTINASTELRQLDITTDKIETIKVFEKTVFQRLLAEKSRQLYISFADVWPGETSAAPELKASGGILNLNDLSLQVNKALIATGEASIYNQKRSYMLTEIFEHFGQWYGVRRYHYGNSYWNQQPYHWSNGPMWLTLVKLDLSAQTQVLNSDVVGFFYDYERPFNNVVKFGDFILTSWGKQFDKDGKPVEIPGLSMFYSSFASGNSLYLYGKDIQRLDLINGKIAVSTPKSTEGTSLIRRSGVAKIDDSLYFPAFDAVNGERMLVAKADNLAPVALPDVASTQTGDTIAIDVLKNDADPDGDALLVKTATAGRGSVKIENGKQLIYQADKSFVGTDTIEYEIQDSAGNAATSKVSVTIKAANRLPQVQDSTASVDSGTTNTIELKSFLSDPDGDELKIVSAQAQQGQVSILNSTQLQYVGKAGFSGTDLIEFSVQDTKGGTAAGKVTVTVKQVVTPQPEPVETKKSGGAGGGLLLIAILFLFNRLNGKR